MLHNRLSGKDFLQIGILESEVEIGMGQGKIKIKTKEWANMFLPFQGSFIFPLLEEMIENVPHVQVLRISYTVPQEI